MALAADAPQGAECRVPIIVTPGRLGERDNGVIEEMTPFCKRARASAGIAIHPEGLVDFATREPFFSRLVLTANRAIMDCCRPVQNRIGMEFALRLLPRTEDRRRRPQPR